MLPAGQLPDCEERDPCARPPQLQLQPERQRRRLATLLAGAVRTLLQVIHGLEQDRHIKGWSDKEHFMKYENFWNPTCALIRQSLSLPLRPVLLEWD